MYSLYTGLIGVLISIMVAFNGVLANYIGNNYSSIIIHIVGLLGISFILMLNKNKISIPKNIPLYMYSAGAIGVLTVLFSNISFNALGASVTLSLGLLGQSVSSIMIDNYGLFGMKVNKFNKKKIIGFTLISLGIVIMTFY
ncbi:DMT family transporter [Romboutsia sp.]|uniref:DMT family transporter n=1 Tax=Romboutsia sp. TaxID=1965302 RepID=UPI002D06368D|nr:DMT family transporter [Romboutsia sp.]HSQ87672.1 DMT family transporter [Romboutsia sp.]